MYNKHFYFYGVQLNTVKITQKNLARKIYGNMARNQIVFPKYAIHTNQFTYVFLLSHTAICIYLSLISVKIWGLETNCDIIPVWRFESLLVYISLIFKYSPQRSCHWPSAFVVKALISFSTTSFTAIQHIAIKQHIYTVSVIQRQA
jgi:hypothetical protein